MDFAQEGSQRLPAAQDLVPAGPNIETEPEATMMTDISHHRFVVEDESDVSMVQVISEAPTAPDEESISLSVPQSMSAFAAAAELVEQRECSVREMTDEQGSAKQAETAAPSPGVDLESLREEAPHVSPRRSTRQRQRVNYKVTSVEDGADYVGDTSNRQRTRTARSKPEIAPRSDRGLRSRSVSRCVTKTPF